MPTRRDPSPRSHGWRKFPRMTFVSPVPPSYGSALSTTARKI